MFAACCVYWPLSFACVYTIQIFMLECFYFENICIFLRILVMLILKEGFFDYNIFSIFTIIYFLFIIINEKHKMQMAPIKIKPIRYFLGLNKQYIIVFVLSWQKT